MISACLIVKNEAFCLKDCLASLKNAVDEIIVVDTGSQDQTLRIASHYTSRLFHFPWNDHFSTARNFALDQAQGQWILCIDADERLQNASKLRAFVAQQDPAQLQGFSFQLQSAQADPVYKRALWPHLPGIRFEGRVHEQLFYQGRPLPLRPVKELILLHQPLKARQAQAKAAYYQRLIAADLADLKAQPSDAQEAHLLRHLGEAQQTLRQIQAARKSFEKALEAYQRAGLPRQNLFYFNLLLDWLNLANEPELMQKRAQELCGLAPDLQLAWWALAWAEFRLNQPQACLKALEKLAGLGPLSPEQLWQAGLLEARSQALLGQAKTALELIWNLKQRFPQNKEIDWHLARLLFINGQTQTALSQLQPWQRLSSAAEALALLSKQTLWQSAEQEELLNLKQKFDRVN